MSNMPSGRDIHLTKPYIPRNLDEETLASMRALPDPQQLERSALNDSSSDSDDEGAKRKMPSAFPGAFPGSSSTASNRNDYY